MQYSESDPIYIQTFEDPSELTHCVETVSTEFTLHFSFLTTFYSSLYLIVEPDINDIYGDTGMINSRIGHDENSLVLILNPTLIFVSNLNDPDFRYNNSVDYYSSRILLFNAFSGVCSEYVYFQGIRPVVNDISKVILTTNKNKEPRWYKDVGGDTDCGRYTDTENLCGYVIQMRNFSREHFNITFHLKRHDDSWESIRKYPSFFHEASYSDDLRSIELNTSTETVSNRTFHVFYCTKGVKFKGSYWTKWTAPFDPPTWSCFIFSLLCCIGLLRFTKSNSNSIFLVLQLLAKQDVKPTTLTKFQILLSISFIFLTMTYEGLITSQIVTPLPVVSLKTLKSVLDDGYRFTFPVPSMEIFFKHFNNFGDFVNGFKLRGQHHRWNNSFMADPNRRGWKFRLRHNLSLKAVVDRPKDEAFADAYRLKPNHCGIVEEYFFIRIYTWMFRNRGHQAFPRFLRRTRDAGFFEKFTRREDLKRLKLKLATEEKEEKVRISFISLRSGVYTIFGITGVILFFALISFGMEKYLPSLANKIMSF